MKSKRQQQQQQPLTPARAKTCMCVWKVSHKTQFPFYQFIKQAKQSKYMVIGIN